MTLGVGGVDFSGLGLDVPRAAVESDLGQEDFLELMLTQLKNQDPFKPLESGEFLGQLAQFGTVSGLAELKSSFESLAGSLVSSQSLQAAGLVGRSALVESSRVAVTEGQSVVGAVDMPTASGSVSVDVRDAVGQVVRKIELGSQPAGLATFTWDGITADGTPAPTGRYSFTAEFNSQGKVEAAHTLVSSSVESVLFGGNGLTLRVRGVGDVPFGAVREVRETPASAAPAQAVASSN